jgi:hypothetical protein
MEIDVRGVVAPGIAILLLASLLSGCTSSPTQPLSPEPHAEPIVVSGTAQYVAPVQALCVPPAGWTSEPVQTQNWRTTHQVWLSPSGHTAYGVIHFTLPLPVGTDPVLWVFMNQMRREQGDAKLLSKQWDSNIKGVRFVAQGGLYTVRTNLLLRGFDGWAIYAGTHNDEAVVDNELALAERAREQTQVATGVVH